MSWNMLYWDLTLLKEAYNLKKVELTMDKHEQYKIIKALHEGKITKAR